MAGGLWHWIVLLLTLLVLGIGVLALVRLVNRRRD